MSSPTAPGDLDLSGTIFLVADDKAFYREMVHSALMRCHPREVKHAATVEKAVEILNRFGQMIGGVICDWDMPPPGGIELLRMIRSRALAKTSPQTCVVIVTARADAAAIKAAMALDVNGVALAPLSNEKLIKTVANAMARKWTLQPAAHYAAVPCVMLPQAAPEKPTSSGPRGEIIRAAAPQAGATAAKPAAKKKDELVNVRMLPLAEVQPGAILGRDIKDRDGQLLLTAGTTLSAALLERLNGIAEGHADSYHIWTGEKPK
jgi:DNA-binding NarL/FixJ family response regulator